jgi:hypothetical protein
MLLQQADRTRAQLQFHSLVAQTLAAVGLLAGIEQTLSPRPYGGIDIGEGTYVIGIA